MTEVAFSAIPGERPAIVTVVATALEVAAMDDPQHGPRLVLIVDGSADFLGSANPEPCRLAIALPPLDGARVAVDLHAAASAALATPGRPGASGG